MPGALLIISRVQVAVLRHNKLNAQHLDQHLLRDILTSFNGYRKKRKIVKDEKKFHGTVDESSSEQQFCKLDAITFVV